MVVAREGRLNEFSPAEAAEPNGVEVIVGKAAVQIGESIHRVPLRSTPEITEARLHDGTPPVIELLLSYPAYATRFGMRPPRYTALRFPVGQGALADARQVVAHFRGDLPGEPDFLHGRGDGTDAEDLSKCYHCGYETHKFRSHCPKCGTVCNPADGRGASVSAWSFAGSSSAGSWATCCSRWDRRCSTRGLAGRGFQARRTGANGSGDLRSSAGFRADGARLRALADVYRAPQAGDPLRGRNRRPPSAAGLRALAAGG